MKTSEKLKHYSDIKKLNVNSSLTYFKMAMEELLVEAYNKHNDADWFEKSSDLMKDVFDDALMDSFIIEQINKTVSGMEKE